MKVQAKIISAFLDELKHQVLGITDTIRSGDDGFESSCIWQVEYIRKAIDLFRIKTLTPVTPISKDSERKYLHIARIARNKPPEEILINDNIAIYKSDLYFFIKKRLPEIKNLSEIKNDHLLVTIEGSIIFGSRHERDVYSNEWFSTSMAVLDDIVREIIQYREEHPQLALF